MESKLGWKWVERESGVRITTRVKGGENVGGSGEKRDGGGEKERIRLN